MSARVLANRCMTRYPDHRPEDSGFQCNSLQAHAIRKLVASPTVTRLTRQRASVYMTVCTAETLPARSGARILCQPGPTGPGGLRAVPTRRRGIGGLLGGARSPSRDSDLSRVLQYKSVAQYKVLPHFGPRSIVGARGRRRACSVASVAHRSMLVLRGGI
jgi:hypothetical protein